MRTDNHLLRAVVLTRRATLADYLACALCGSVLALILFLFVR
jgi:hypothetical protein